MKKSTAVLTLLLALLLALPAAAQEDETAELKDKRMEVYLVLDANLLEVTSYNYDHADIRGSGMQNYVATQLPLSGIAYWKDSYVYLQYNGSNYGGRFKLTQGSITNNNFGNVHGWVKFGLLKVAVGNDNDSKYADSLGADPELRLYTGLSGETVSWTASRNPDNITGGEGVLLEGDLKPLTISVAAGGFQYKPNLQLTLTDTNTHLLRVDQSFRYGVRAGYELPSQGKLNVSYMITEKKTATAYYNKLNSDELVATQPNAETFEHLLGVYGSLHLTDNFDLTVGYNGMLTAYLPEFYNLTAKEMVKTGYPLVFKNGLNLNARYRMNPLTFRTDNSLSFWVDKNYQLFESGNTAWTDLGNSADTVADRYAGISHFVMWNGFGLSYALTDAIGIAGYLRNLLSIYSAEGTVPTGTGVYSLLRDEISFDVGFTLQFNANIEAFVKVGAGYLLTSRSEELNRQSPSWFITHIDNNNSKPAPTPVATIDNQISFRIPIGVRVRY
jgi:hypothetical protein